MALDYQLINDNIDSVTKSLRSSMFLDPRLLKIKSPLTSEMMTKLTQYLKDMYHSPLWVPETVQYDEKIDYVQRFKIMWDAETVFEELYEVCQSITPVVNEIHPNSQSSFQGIMLWRDHPGYYINWHTDNSIIGVSMQIYIAGPDICPGTEFQTINGIESIPFVANSGYITQNKITHRVTEKLSGSEVRYSLFAIWNR